MASKQVRTVEELKKLSNVDGGVDFFILLAGGCVRSSKHIDWDDEGKKFCVLNEIDGTEEFLTEEEIVDDKITMIGKAMRTGNFYMY